MLQYNLIATNTAFCHKKNRLWTHKRPNGQKAQLDYILIRRKWFNSVKNSRSYNSFESINSDHRIVSCHCMISYRESKRPHENPMTKIDWKAASRDRQIANFYDVSVSNKFNALMDIEEDISISNKYDRLVEVNKAAAVEILPKKTKKSNDFQSKRIT